MDSLEGRLRDTALRLRERVQRQAVLDEGIGVLQQWGGRDAATDVRRGLYRDFGSGGQEIEAARVVAIVNAGANPAADPDWD